MQRWVQVFNGYSRKVEIKRYRKEGGSSEVHYPRLLTAYFCNCVSFKVVIFSIIDLTFEETKLYKALLGVRGMGSVDMDQLIQIMVRFSVLILDLPEIKDLPDGVMVSGCCVQGSTYKITLEKSIPWKVFPNLC